MTESTIRTWAAATGIISLMFAIFRNMLSESSRHAGCSYHSNMVFSNYLIAARHNADKWILMRCTGNVVKKTLEIFKGQYIIKSLDGLAKVTITE